MRKTTPVEGVRIVPLADRVVAEAEQYLSGCQRCAPHASVELQSLLRMQKFYTDKPSRIDGKDKHIYCRDGIDAPQDMKVFTCHFPTGPFNLKEGITTQ